MQDPTTKSPDLKPLLIRISEDDESAFRDIYTIYAPKVYTFALKLTASAASAEEMVQEVFLKIWVHRKGLPSVTYFPSYLYTVSRNLGFNMLKRLAVEQRAKAVFAQNLAPAKNETEEAVIFEDYKYILARAVELLPPQQKLVYGLCHLEGLKYNEAAKKLRISPLTVKSHMQQAIRAIKKHFRSIVAACAAWILYV